MSGKEIQNYKKNNQRKEKSNPNQNETEEIETTHHQQSLCSIIRETLVQNKQFQQFAVDIEHISKNNVMLSEEEEFQNDEDQDQEIEQDLKKFQKTNEESEKLTTPCNKDQLEQNQNQESYYLEGDSDINFMVNVFNSSDSISPENRSDWSSFDMIREEQEKEEKKALHKHSEILKKKLEYLKEVNSYLEQQNKLDSSINNQVLDLNQETLEKQIQTYQKEALELQQQNSIYFQQIIQERKNQQEILGEQIFSFLEIYKNTVRLNNELIKNQKDNSEKFKLSQVCAIMDKVKFKIDLYRTSLVRMLVDSFLSKNQSKTGYQFKDLTEYFDDENGQKNQQRFYCFLQKLNITKDNWNKIQQQKQIFDYFPPTIEEITDNMYLANQKDVCCQSVHRYNEMYNYLIKNIQNDKQ